MSRIGKLPISIPAGVTVSVNDENVVSVKGPKGEMSQAVHPSIKLRLLILRLFLPLMSRMILWK